MGFNKVYRALQEIFPEVDSRVLRAVSIEHSKDADRAVEVVLTEVIPFLTEKSRPSSSSSERSMAKPPKVDARAVAQIDDRLFIDLTGLDDEENNAADYDVNAGHTQSVLSVDSGRHELLTEFNSDHLEVYGECASGETVLSDKFQDANIVGVSDQTSDLETVLPEKSQEIDTENVTNQVSDLTSSTMKDPDEGASLMNDAMHASVGGSDESCGLAYVKEGHRDSDEENSNVSVGLDNVKDAHRDSDEEKSNVSADLDYVKDSNRDSDEEKSNASVGLVASSSTQDVMLLPEGSGELIDVPDILNLDSQYSVIAASKNDMLGEMVDIADDCTLNTIVTRSGQICRVDLLEGIIEDARTNKKTLFSTMESVISLMREVELQEQAAERAKEAVAIAGLDILSRVEDLKKMLQHAKEANDMHTGEVYGERAILATEVRELQSRLLSLSDERDQSLAVLDEMHQTLQSRLEAAEEATKVAEKERLEKEESARKSLTEQELVMEKVVAEANMLKQEAEENAKLQEFLVDRGHLVDMLQGEISVICQDVKLLKEKFDERIPFSKSLFTSQTSCLLASSSFSFKSITHDQVDQVPDISDDSDLSNNLKKSLNDVLPSTNEHQLLSEGPTSGDDHKALLEEGWEICEDGDYM